VVESLQNATINSQTPGGFSRFAASDWSRNWADLLGRG
jgi:hypothetical protein